MRRGTPRKKEYRVQTNYPRLTADRVELFIDGISKEVTVMPVSQTGRYVLDLHRKGYMPIEESTALQYLERKMESQL